MCRMLGYVTRTPATLADLLGEQDLQDFAELSRKHGDGWGFARAVGDVMEVTKAADAARTGPAVAGPNPAPSDETGAHGMQKVRGFESP